MLPFSFYLELMIAACMAVIVAVMWRRGRADQFAVERGWWLIFCGFVLLLFGALVDISDHFPSLGRFGILGRTSYQSLAEKLVGFFGGFVCLALGFVRWLPQIAERRRLEKSLRKANLELQAAVLEGSQEIRLSRLRNEIAQRRHRRTANLLETMVSGAAVAIFATDEQGRVTHVAGRALEALGIDRSAVGRPLARLLPPAEQPLAQTLDAGISTIAEVEHDEHTFQLRLAPFDDGDGAVVVASDVTELTQIQSELRSAKEQAEAANRAKSAFLATMSHELRTPLNSVIGFAAVLEKNRGGRLVKSELLYVERIRDNGLHLLELINDILDLSKIEAGHLELSPQLTDVGAVIREVVRGAGTQRHDDVDLQTSIPEALEPIDTDPGRLRQIIENLVSNALKFTHHGHVRIELRADGDGTRPVQLSVTDSGIGIPADRLGAVFEPFQQVDASTSRLYGGSGLGLSICRSLATALGFAIKVESEQDRGTTFTVDFAPSPAALERQRAPSAVVAFGAPTVVADSDQ